MEFILGLLLLIIILCIMLVGGVTYIIRSICRGLAMIIKSFRTN